MFVSLLLKSKQRPGAFFEMRASAFLALPAFVLRATLFSFIKSSKENIGRHSSVTVKLHQFTWQLTVAFEALSNGPLRDAAVGRHRHQDLSLLFAVTSVLLDPLQLPHRTSVLPARVAETKRILSC